MKTQGLLLLDVYTAGRGNAESARLIYDPKVGVVYGYFNYGDVRR